MQDEDVRRELLRQWTYTGGPSEGEAAELYHDDAVLEFPHSGERFAGRADVQAWRQRYPARRDVEPRQLRGHGDIWVPRPTCATTATSRPPSTAGADRPSGGAGRGRPAASGGRGRVA
jgi:hypothetical protein